MKPKIFAMINEDKVTENLWNKRTKWGKGIEWLNRKVFMELASTAKGNELG